MKSHLNASIACFSVSAAIGEAPQTTVRRSSYLRSATSGTKTRQAWIIAGTISTSVTPSSSSARTTSGGLKSSWISRLPPPATALKQRIAAAAWYIGATTSARSPASKESPATTICSTLEQIARCCTTAPFGRPVVPLVYIW